ncbi:MAG: winged helix-turn-helix transcriptional regulator [Ottowia sp.]
MKVESEKLDNYDRRILEALQENADIAVAELAERVGLTTSPCWRRVQRLEERGVIRKSVFTISSPTILG